jgi:hypothetical protein
VSLIKYLAMGKLEEMRRQLTNRSIYSRGKMHFVFVE